MSVQYYEDFELNISEKVFCDMPDCPNFYSRIIRPSESMKQCVGYRLMTFPEPPEEGWVTFRYMLTDEIEERADYCPECAKKLGIGE